MLAQATTREHTKGETVLFTRAAEISEYNVENRKAGTFRFFMMPESTAPRVKLLHLLQQLHPHSIVEKLDRVKCSSWGLFPCVVADHQSEPASLVDEVEGSALNVAGYVANAA